MPIKTFLTLFFISNLSLWVTAQKSRFTIALQTTTVETPPPFAGFSNFGSNGNDFSTRFHKDFSLEIIGRLHLKEHIALRLRVGVTKYDFDERFTSQSFFDNSKLTGNFEKYAIGMETNHFFGKSLAFRFGGDLQLGFFKNMTDKSESNNSTSQGTWVTNNVLSLNPFLGGDWILGRGFALGAEFRMPFERVRYLNKGTFSFNANNTTITSEFDRDGISYVGFGTPVSSIQLSYRF